MNGWLGDLHAADGNWEQVIAAYSTSITPETTDAKLLVRLGEAYMASGQPEVRQHVVALLKDPVIEGRNPNVNLSKKYPGNNFDLLAYMGALGIVGALAGTRVSRDPQVSDAPFGRQYLQQMVSQFGLLIHSESHCDAVSRWPATDFRFRTPGR